MAIDITNSLGSKYLWRRQFYPLGSDVQDVSHAQQLLDMLDQVVIKAGAGEDLAVLFSGGLDSGILAALAKRHAKPHLYTVGLAGSHDISMGEEAASYLELPWTPIIVNEDAMVKAARELLRYEPITSPVVLSYELPLQIIASSVLEGTLMSGQGADELLGGYARYLACEEADLERMMHSDLAEVMAIGAPRDQRITQRYGKRLILPFLDQTVIRLAGCLRVEEKVCGGVRKVVLREAAMELGLGLIADREKKAAQYGSGAMKALRSAARRRQVDLAGLLQELRTESMDSLSEG